VRGFGSFGNKLHLPNPLNLSFSPLGRRDAARLLRTVCCAAESVALVRKDGKPFGADPRGGPWASVIKRDAAFAAAYATQDREHDKSICEGMCRALFDRDTAAGAEPEDLMRVDIPALVIPGHDASHATSAARYLEECLPRSDYWDVPVERQDEDATSARVLEFLAKVGA
jgi:hypothetical protein